jgi:hypothetical protein
MSTPSGNRLVSMTVEASWHCKSNVVAPEADNPQTIKAATVFPAALVPHGRRRTPR